MNKRPIYRIVSNGRKYRIQVLSKTWFGIGRPKWKYLYHYSYFGGSKSKVEFDSKIEAQKFIEIRIEQWEEGSLPFFPVEE